MYNDHIGQHSWKYLNVKYENQAKKKIQIHCFNATVIITSGTRHRPCIPHGTALMTVSNLFPATVLQTDRKEKKVSRITKRLYHLTLPHLRRSAVRQVTCVGFLPSRSDRFWSTLRLNKPQAVQARNKITNTSPLPSLVSHHNLTPFKFSTPSLPPTQGTQAIQYKKVSHQRSNTNLGAIST